jgi:hypothetical protein
VHFVIKLSLGEMLQAAAQPKTPVLARRSRRLASHPVRDLHRFGGLSLASRPRLALIHLS